MSGEARGRTMSDEDGRAWSAKAWRRQGDDDVDEASDDDARAIPGRWPEGSDDDGGERRRRAGDRAAARRRGGQDKGVVPARWVSTLTRPGLMDDE